MTLAGVCGLRLAACGAAATRQQRWQACAEAGSRPGRARPGCEPRAEGVVRRTRSSIVDPRSSLAPHGVSLIEILVATAIIVVVFVPLMTLFTQTIRSTEISLDEVLATNLASEVIEQIEVLPYSAGFHRMVSWPVPNPPPDFPAVHPLPAEGIVLGAPSPDDPPLWRPIDTRGWTEMGYLYCEPEAMPDPLSRELSRLYLSPLPSGYRRTIELHHPLIGAAPPIQDPNLYQVLVRIEWDRTFLGAPTQTRSVELAALVANPTFNP